MQEDEKLHKVLARAGLGSRREMEAAISEGKASVNGKIAKLGDRVKPEDKIVFNGRTIKSEDAKQQRVRVILYNKPEGEICTRSDPEGRPTVFDKLPPLKQGRWISVGRLDFNTSGALLFTNDGDVAHKLMHPSSVIDREYLVRVFGTVDEDVKKRLLEGVMLEDGMARFTDLKESAKDKDRWFYCVVMEGRNREVRRLWESQGLKVNRLKRVRFGNIFIPSHVRSGQWIELTEKEINELALTAGVELSESTARFSPKEKEEYLRHQRKLRGSRRPRR
ncbi:MAG: 23S rRNA pseudouridine(2605) synthase RluB [Cellvibrionaceae bacterium]